MADNVITEISSAVEKLQLCEGQIRLIPAAQAEQIYLRALAHFVAGPDRRWWWEAFRLAQTCVSFPEPVNFRMVAAAIAQIVPDADEPVWFMVEETLLPYYPVYEATTSAALSVVGECYGFEYYLISKNLQWLVCENHHNRVIAVGEPVIRRAEAIIQAGPSLTSGHA